MKRKLTLAIGCLAAAMPSMKADNSAAPARTSNVAQAARQLNLLGATQAAQAELERRELAVDHSIASVVFLKGVQPSESHYDVRIEPPANLTDGLRLRGFSVAMDGRVEPVTGFRATA
jgi:hypothetical protein